jgi:hypothetical protein
MAESESPAGESRFAETPAVFRVCFCSRLKSSLSKPRALCAFLPGASAGLFLR